MSPFARDLVPWDIFTGGAGTGEGLCAAFVHRQSARQGGNIIYDRSNALIDLDEINSLAADGRPQGRLDPARAAQGVDGRGAGVQQPGTRHEHPVEERRSYALGLVAAVQPRKAGIILDDLDGGLTQRFLFLPGDDPDIDPDEPETPYEPPDIEGEPR